MGGRSGADHAICGCVRMGAPASFHRKRQKVCSPRFHCIFYLSAIIACLSSESGLQMLWRDSGSSACGFTRAALLSPLSSIIASEQPLSGERALSRLIIACLSPDIARERIAAAMERLPVHLPAIFRPAPSIGRTSVFIIYYRDCAHRRFAEPRTLSPWMDGFAFSQYC